MRGDAGETERGPSCVMVAGPPHARALSLAPGPLHLTSHPLCWSPGTFHSPHPPPPKGKEKRKKKRDGKKENKISTVVETRGEK